MNKDEERRREERLPIELHLEVSEVFKQDHVVIKNINAEVSVVDISKTGIGFISKADLPLEYYFNGKIVLGEASRFIYAVVQIVRKSEATSQGHIYGAKFIGLAPFLANKIDEYASKVQL